MDQNAELGIAAHAFYKDDVGSPTELLSGIQRLAWLRHTVGICRKRQSGRVSGAYQARAVSRPGCSASTPKGKLNRAAAPGQCDRLRLCRAHRCRQQCGGCKINGKFAPLSSELQNGDEVEVRLGSPVVAAIGWESLAVTGKARAAIRRATRTAVRDQYAGLGRALWSGCSSTRKNEYADEQS